MWGFSILRKEKKSMFKNPGKHLLLQHDNSGRQIGFGGITGGSFFM